MNQTIQFIAASKVVRPRRRSIWPAARIAALHRPVFAEKLNVPVDYFNPFRNIQIDPEINLEEMAGRPSFGEVVGLASVIGAVPGGVESLPASHLAQQFSQAALFRNRLLCADALLAFGWFFGWMADRNRQAGGNPQEDRAQAEQGHVGRGHQGICRGLPDAAIPRHRGSRRR